MRKGLAIGFTVPFAVVMFAACNSGDNNGSDASTDATNPTDVVTEKKPLPESSTSDVNTGTCSPSTTIDTSQVTWVAPITPNANACSATQVQALYDGCFGTNASSTACNGFINTSANTTCYACMVSTYGKSTSYGALVQIGGVDYANIAGCIAVLTGDTSSTGCGAKDQAVTDCETLACEDNCPEVTDNTSFEEYTNCTQAADQGVCASYISAECDLQDAGLDGAASAYATCVNQSSFENYYFAMATVFCGNYAVDAGTDAGTDAETDAAEDAPDGD